MKYVIGLLLSIYLPTVLGADAFWQHNLTGESHAITVYRSASCGCCKGWIDHLRTHNFAVEDIVVEAVDPHKARLGVPPGAASCHTAVVDGVVIEGHVPAQDIKRLLSAQHDIRLLTVPAMPSGTPGMDFPGAPKQDFKVFAINNADEVSVFNEYSDY